MQKEMQLQALNEKIFMTPNSCHTWYETYHSCHTWYETAGIALAMSSALMMPLPIHVRVIRMKP
jgi:hypothetical protein